MNRYRALPWLCKGFNAPSAFVSHYVKLANFKNMYVIKQNAWYYIPHKSMIN